MRSDQILIMIHIMDIESKMMCDITDTDGYVDLNCTAMGVAKRYASTVSVSV
jgi:hypothetical protein